MDAKALFGMALALLLVSVYFGPASAVDSTQPRLERSHWQETTDSKCQVWSPDVELNEAVSWSGPCLSGKAEGYGTVVFRWPENGAWREERYEGEMKGGKQHGRGTLYYAGGRRFTGTFRDDKPYAGRLDFPDGAHYDGAFADDDFDGQGRYTYRDGSYYVGQFKKGLPNGDGSLHKQGDEPVSGHWTNGCLRQGNRWAVAGVSKEKCGFR